MPRTEWIRRTVGEVMQRNLEPIEITPEADALDALGKMQRSGCSRLLVVEHEQLLGIISLKDLLQFLDLKMELESGEDNNLDRST